MTLTARGISLALVAVLTGTLSLHAQTNPPVFRSGVDIVSVTAVVRDRHKRVVPSLRPSDLQVVDAGELQEILDLEADRSAPASVALLVDGSGSMVLGASLAAARRISHAILDSLDPHRDDAALLTFDRRLVTLQDFTSDFGAVRDAIGRLEAFGSTSLYDAIAGAAGTISNRAQRRRAIIVLTDGADTASSFSPERVSLIASSIDVPVYVFALGDAALPDSARASSLATIAKETGGELFVANNPKLVDAGVRTLLEELHHQYVLSFRANPFDGLRRLQVRAVRKDLTVRARGWYFAGD